MLNSKLEAIASRLEAIAIGVGSSGFQATLSVRFLDGGGFDMKGDGPGGDKCDCPPRLFSRSPQATSPHTNCCGQTLGA